MKIYHVTSININDSVCDIFVMVAVYSCREKEDWKAVKRHCRRSSPAPGSGAALFVIDSEDDSIITSNLTHNEINLLIIWIFLDAFYSLSGIEYYNITFIMYILLLKVLCEFTKFVLFVEESYRIYEHTFMNSITVSKFLRNLLVSK